MPRTVCTIQRIGGIALDLAAQPVDLHVDRALADAVATVARPARGAAPSRPGLLASSAQHVAFAVGEVDDVVAALQLAAREMEDEVAEAHRLDRRRRGAGARA